MFLSVPEGYRRLSEATVRVPALGAALLGLVRPGADSTPGQAPLMALWPVLAWEVAQTATA